VRPLAHRLLTGSVVNDTTNNQIGGASVISMNRLFLAGAVAAAAAAVLTASGCGVTGAMDRAGEVRVATQLEAGSAKMIVAGPARLLHVDVHGRQTLDIYSVRRGADGSFNCADPGRTQLQPLRHGASNELDLIVPADQAICLASEAGAPHSADVSWHARRGAAPPAETLTASNL